jgi:hypothetical protein
MSITFFEIALLRILSGQLVWPFVFGPASNGVLESQFGSIPLTLGGELSIAKLLSVSKNFFLTRTLWSGRMGLMKTQVSQRTAPLSKFKGFFRKKAAWLAILPLFVGSLQAQTNLNISLSYDGGNPIGDWQPWTTPIGGGSNQVYDTTYGGSASSFTLHLWNTIVDADPSISANVSVVNNTAFVQNYDLVFTLPISPAITGGSRIAGSVQGGITDADGSGSAILSTLGPGTALYYGQIDGANILPLFPNLTTMTVTNAYDSISQFTSAGIPGVTIPGPNALTSIGIEQKFSLTPGDQATFTSVFVVLPVPEPSSLGLLAIGSLMFVCRRRR